MGCCLHHPVLEMVGLHVVFDSGSGSESGSGSGFAGSGSDY